MITIEDETLRDGLQSEKTILTSEQKINIFNLLIQAGLKRIQVGSFVHPKYVPQMADVDELISSLDVPEDVTITGLVLNNKGLDRAVNSGLKHLSMSVSVSDTHSQKNTNMSTEKALASMRQLIESAVSSGIQVRAGAQCAFGCVYEGPVSEQRVVEVLEPLVQAGAQEINLADTTGFATPRTVRNLVKKIHETFPHIVISLHLHNTQGFGLANMMAGYEAGAQLFDTAIGGLGGCPVIKNASGNVSTEDAVNLFSSLNVDMNIDLKILCSAHDLIQQYVNHSLSSYICRVIQASEKC